MVDISDGTGARPEKLVDGRDTSVLVFVATPKPHRRQSCCTKCRESHDDDKRTWELKDVRNLPWRHIWFPTSHPGVVPRWRLGNK